MHTLTELPTSFVMEPSPIGRFSQLSQELTQVVGIKGFKCILCEVSSSAFKALILLVLTLFFSVSSFPYQLGYAFSSPEISKLADAIFKAENSQNHPYGVLGHGCNSQNVEQCRKVCINTIRNTQKRYYSQSRSESYISYLSKAYAPVGALNDKTGLNKNWIKNVEFFYNKETL